MQKKIIALALAGLASSAAFAQSNVTIYGRVDYGFMDRGGNAGGVGGVVRKHEMASGIEAGSRVGFKGSEDLGNGLKAIFQMEFGSVAMDEGGGLASSRNAYVGLTGKFGTLVGGKLDGIRYGIFNKYDAFGGGDVGNFTQMTAQVDRASNAVAYISPTFMGLTGTLAYATHIGTSNPLGLSASEATANNGDAVLNSAMLAYANGPISANLDFERVKFNNGGAPASTAAAVEEVNVMTVAGAYDFKVVKLSALYDTLETENRRGGRDANVQSWFVSAKAPVGNFVLKATYGQTKDKEVDDSKAKKYGIGADYILSKRTLVYAGYGHISQGQNSDIQLSQAGNGFASGYGTNGYNLGVAHTF
jgi:predicted porin